MFAYIKGTVEYIDIDNFVLENNDIGYRLYASNSSLAQLSLHDKVKVHTYLNVKEDGVTMFGFVTKDELEAFKLLLGVSGIGPKGALAILSVLSVDELRMAVLSDDFKAISKANGVGPKTAQRAVIELKDKFKFEDVLPSIAGVADSSVTKSKNSGANESFSEAVLALTSLGYSNIEAMQAVKKIGDIEGLSVEDIIKKALKTMVGI